MVYAVGKMYTYTAVVCYTTNDIRVTIYNNDHVLFGRNG
jgi:hypothetical protein